jgi:hypothetical protein
MNGRIRQLIAGAAAPAILLASVSCGNVVRTGRSPSFLVIDTLQAASGATPGTMGVPLASDVQTIVKRAVNGVDIFVPTRFNDVGSATIRVVLKNPGTPGSETSPSNLNAVTLTRYRVEFVRSDGRNVPGVDIPYAFDGSSTATITSTPSTVPFEIVRSNAKDEDPLRSLVGGGGRLIIATIAQVTFYGHDLTGNEVEVTGSISVNFADFGDPS